MGEEEGLDHIFTCDVVILGLNLYARNTVFKVYHVRQRSAGPNWTCMFLHYSFISTLSLLPVKS